MLRLEQRPEISRRLQMASPPLAVVLTIVAGLIMFAALGVNPIDGFVTYFLYPLKNLYSIAELLLKATSLALCAIGLAIGFRANVWNIGAEGQFMAGAVAATGVALTVGDLHGVSLVLMLLAGITGGALWSAIPAFLRTRFNTNEILVSLMLVYVAELLVSWLVFGPWKDPKGFNFPQTEMFDAAAMLPIVLPGTRLNLAFGLMIGLLIAAYIFTQRTHLGFKMRVAGEAPEAARYAGFSSRQMIWIGLLVGGGCAGLAGMAEVAGPMGQLTDKMSLGYGFAAIIVAFVGRLHPLGIFFAALLMALFYIGGEQAQQYLGMPASISKVFQGMLLFFLLATDVLARYRVRWT